jgi:hypothetical protein
VPSAPNNSVRNRRLLPQVSHVLSEDQASNTNRKKAAADWCGKQCSHISGAACVEGGERTSNRGGVPVSKANDCAVEGFRST